MNVARIRSYSVASPRAMRNGCNGSKPPESRLSSAGENWDHAVRGSGRAVTVPEKRGAGLVEFPCTKLDVCKLVTKVLL